MATTRKSKIFYGYWVALGAFCSYFIFGGCEAYAFSLFVTPFQTDFGWGRGEIMLGWTIFSMVVAVSSPFVGRWISVYGVRRVVLIGVTFSGLGFCALALTNNLWYFYIGQAVIGFGMAAAGVIPASVLISNWFEKHRGLVMGIASTGMGIGGMIVAPVVGGYLIPNFGWRMAFLSLGIFTWALVFPFALFVIKTKPSDMGLYPDGVDSASDAANHASRPASPVLTQRMVLTSLAFWLMVVTFLARGIGILGIHQNQVPYLQDAGYPMATAAMAFGGVAFFNAIGKFTFGWLCDWIQAKYVIVIGLLLQIAAIFILLNVEESTPLAVIWLYVALWGLGMGSWLPTMSVLTSATFGLVSFSTVFGILNLPWRIGSAIGPLIAGYMFDLMGSYHQVFIIFLGLCTIAIPVTLAVRRPRFLNEAGKGDSSR